MRFQLLMLLTAVVSTLADNQGDESAAIKTIELLDGKVTRDATLPGRSVVDVDFRGSKRLSDGYLHLLGEIRVIH